MGRRRRRVVKIVKKKLPTVFSCPSCGEEAVKVVMGRGGSRATVQCAACGLKQEFEASPSDQVVDVYCKFTDRFYGVREPLTPKQEYIPEETVRETQAHGEAQEESRGEGQTVGEEPASEAMPQSPERQLEGHEASEERTEETEQPADEDTQVE